MFLRFRLKLLLLPIRNNAKQLGSDSTLNKSDLPVSISKRIERSPTDLLKALARTVGRDPTAFHYKFPDDPYFEITSNNFKRNLALSIESGRKSARWIVDNNPQFFNEKISEPFIQAFSSKPELNENSVVGEETLVNAIKQKNITDAISIYDILIEKGIELSPSTKQTLLTLLCFYNCDAIDSRLDLETKWFREMEKTKVAKTWKDGGIAEKVFQSITPDCPLATSTLIQGMLKYGQIDRAMEYYHKAKSKNLKLSLGVYNGILANVRVIKSTKKWEYILEILNEIKSMKLRPDIYTLNAILETMSSASDLSGKEEEAAATLMEFQKLKIEPSLGTYYYLITMFSSSNKNRRLRSKQLFRIIRTLGRKELQIQHPSDLFFFPSAMTFCNKFLINVDLAHALHKILMKSDNVKFLADNIQEIIYYKEYLHLCFHLEPIEHAMSLYQNLVPAVCNPDPALFRKVLSKIVENNAFQFLPDVWKNIESQSLGMKVRMASHLLNLMDLVSWVEKEEENHKQDEKVSEIFCQAATFILNDLTWEENSIENESTDVILTDAIASNMLAAFIWSKDNEKAGCLFTKIYNSLNLFGFSPSALRLFNKFAFSNQMYNEAVMCLKLAESNMNPEISEMAKVALPHLSKMSESCRSWIENLSVAEKPKEPAPDDGPPREEASQ